MIKVFLSLFDIFLCIVFVHSFKISFTIKSKFVNSQPLAETQIIGSRSHSWPVLLVWIICIGWMSSLDIWLESVCINAVNPWAAGGINLRPYVLCDLRNLTRYELVAYYNKWIPTMDFKPSVCVFSIISIHTFACFQRNLAAASLRQLPNSY